MSGGSHNYICFRIEEELVGQMHDAELDDLMRDIADLAHSLEWAESGDASEESYKEAVRGFKAKWLKVKEKERLKEYVDERSDLTEPSINQMLESCEKELARMERSVEALTAQQTKIKELVDKLP